MSPADRSASNSMEERLRRTLDDGRLSRSERRALVEVLADLAPGPEARARHLRTSFELAREALSRVGEEKALEWLLAITKLVLNEGLPEPRGEVADVLFEPRDEVPPRLISMIDGCRRSLELCVFTITDNRLSSPIEAAHRRGVRVRLITDDDKARDRGSDIWRFVDAGLEVRLDPYPDHMHHKFAVFDGRELVTGSYNWTRGAAERNLENVLITDDPRLVRPYAEEFERLWEQFEPVD